MVSLSGWAALTVTALWIGTLLAIAMQFAFDLIILGLIAGLTAVLGVVLLAMGSRTSAKAALLVLLIVGGLLLATLLYKGSLPPVQVP